jgi:hypothetical protein
MFIYLHIYILLYMQMIFFYKDGQKTLILLDDREYSA